MKHPTIQELKGYLVMHYLGVLRQKKGETDDQYRERLAHRAGLRGYGCRRRV